MNLQLTPPEPFGFEEKKHFATYWISEWSREIEDKDDLPDEPLWFTLLVYKNPTLCWELIKLIFSMTDNKNALGALAAGPLEELLAQHGSDFIDQIEILAYEDLRFRKLLKGLYRNAMTDEVWNTVTYLREL